MPQAHQADAAFLFARRDHDGGFELVDAIPREDSAVAAVEEGIVLKLRDGECRRIECVVPGLEIVVGRGDDREEGGMILFVEVRREVGGSDVASSAVNNEAGLDLGIVLEGWLLIFHFAFISMISDCQCCSFLDL